MKAHQKQDNSSPALILKVKERMELMNFLLLAYPAKSRSKVKNLLSKQQVQVNGKVVSQFNYQLLPGNEVCIGKEKKVAPVTASSGFTIIHEDKHLIVVDKQAGMLTIATEGEKSKTVYYELSNYVKQQHHCNKIFIVHRLDRDTSGVLLFARNPKIQRLLQDNWNDAVLERTYIAITEGVVEKDEGVITSWLHENNSMVVCSSQNPEGGKKAITHYKVLRRSKQYSMLELNLETGRKNQIRVHMQDIGHSIINDKKYGAKTNPIGRLGLHAKCLGFVHPVTQEKLLFQSPIPKKFRALFAAAVR
jgi:23S rRNA pseudouridine1911/1915/1917 synthase